MIGTTTGGSVGRVHELTQALIEDRIQDDEWAELELLLVHSDRDREAYVKAMRLHADLYLHYQRGGSLCSCETSGYRLRSSL